jgi:hypothetical protein
MVKPSCEVALEASEGAPGALAFGAFSGEVVAGFDVVPGTRDRDDVQRVVELAVSAAIEAVLGSLS